MQYNVHRSFNNTRLDCFPVPGKHIPGAMGLGAVPPGDRHQTFGRAFVVKILFISDVSIHHVIGGAERVLYEQTTGLAKRHHQIHVLTRRLPEHEQADETIAGVREWRYQVDQASNLRFFTSTLGYGIQRFEKLQKEFSLTYSTAINPSPLGSPAVPHGKRHSLCLHMPLPILRGVRNPAQKAG